MKQSQRYLVLFFVLSVALAGCMSYDSVGPTGSTCPPDNTLTFENFGREFFETNCSSCHGSEWSDVAAVRRSRQAIDEDAAAGPNGVNTLMPRSGPAPSLTERQRLGQWLACNAP